MNTGPTAEVSDSDGVVHYSIANKLEVQVTDLQEEVDALKAENKHLEKIVEQLMKTKQKDDVFFVKLENYQLASLG